MEFDEESRAQISFSGLEAGRTLIQHGNHVDPSKLVNMAFTLYSEIASRSWSRTRARLRLESSPPTFTSPDHPLRPARSRIYMMRECRDKVDFTFAPDGTTCRLVKARGSRRPRTEHERRLSPSP